MGIVEAELASFELSTFEACRIERNSNGSIHIHMDGLRIELTSAEFNEFAEVVQSGRAELRELKADYESHNDTA